MKYHALLTTNQGINILPINPCKLLKFAMLKLAAGESYSAETRRTRDPGSDPGR